MVVPHPRSNGCAENRPNRSVNELASTSRRFGRWNPFHSIDVVLSKLFLMTRGSHPRTLLPPCTARLRGPMPGRYLE
jgi:hypothetical protein